MLDKLTDSKQFERLAIDLLEAEGLFIEPGSEPRVDPNGTDFLAIEEFKSHGGEVIRVRWRVQCKHYAPSHTNLRRDEVVKILNLFDLTPPADDGLFIIISTDYSHEVDRVLKGYKELHPSRHVKVWNQRQLISKLERHPDILKRYGLSNVNSDFLSIFATLNPSISINTLLISDQSALAHDLARGLRHLGWKLTFLPVWNYQDVTRLQLLRHAIRHDTVDLVVCFLGDSFGLPLPKMLIDIMLACHELGSAMLFFPFLAWSLKSNRNMALRDLIPVELLDPTESRDYNAAYLLGGYKEGDFRELLAFDSFAEDQYMELSSKKNDVEFTRGLSDKFGISHSFEYLRPIRGANVRFKDNFGTPLVVTQENKHGRICYLNTCCHSCLSNVPVLSPLSSSADFSILFRNVLNWLIKDRAA